MPAHSITHTTSDDRSVIVHLFESAIAYQQRKGYPMWNGFSQDAIDADIQSKNGYKIVVDGQIACIFSVCYTDPIVWGQRDKEDAIYLHRIVVNPEFKGLGWVGVITDWAIEHTRTLGRPYVRMDTWANNPNIIAYYESFGFIFLENVWMPDTPELPVQNRNIEVALLERAV